MEIGMMRCQARLVGLSSLLAFAPLVGVCWSETQPASGSAAVATRTVVRLSTPPTRTGTVEIDEASLYYEVFGEGRPVVLLHDGLLHRVAWDDQVDALAADHMVVRYDRRGYGDSSAPTQPFSSIDDLALLLDELKIEKAAVVGSSAGAILALDFTLERPERVETLVLVGAVADGMPYTGQTIRRYRATLSQDPQEVIERWYQDRFLFAAENPEARERFRAVLEASPHNALALMQRLDRSRGTRAIERLDEIRIPTLIITGEFDSPDTHANAGAMQVGIATSQRTVMEGAAHFPYMEKPNEFNELLVDYLGRTSRPVLVAELAELDFECGFADVDGAAIYYECLGEGEPLVLIHGGSIDRRMWDPQFRSLAKKYRVIRYDVRGHGLSPSPPLMYYDFEDLSALLTHLGVESAHVCGLSMGGRIAIDFAIAHPEMTRSLIAVGPAYSGIRFQGEDWQAYLDELLPAYNAGDAAACREIFLKAWTIGPNREATEVDPQVLAHVREMLVYGWDDSRNLGQTLPTTPIAAEILGEIDVPALLVLGELDMSDIDLAVETLHSELPRSTLVRIPGAAHMVNLEQPELFDEALLSFLEEVDGAEEETD
jgi:3-oxoadipate enol-lactonase